MATYNLATSLFCTPQSLFRTILDNAVAVPELWFLHSRICCRDLGAFAPNDKHRLEKQWSHLAFTTSTVAPVRLARLAWFPSQANLPQYGFWRWTWQMSHWTWNAKSTVGKARSSRTQNQPGSSWPNWWLPTTSQLHLFVLHNLHLGPI